MIVLPPGFALPMRGPTEAKAKATDPFSQGDVFEHHLGLDYGVNGLCPQLLGAQVANVQLVN